MGGGRSKGREMGIRQNGTFWIRGNPLGNVLGGGGGESSAAPLEPAQVSSLPGQDPA